MKGILHIYQIQYNIKAINISSLLSARAREKSTDFSDAIFFGHFFLFWSTSATWWNIMCWQNIMYCTLSCFLALCIGRGIYLIINHLLNEMLPHVFSNVSGCLTDAVHIAAKWKQRPKLSNFRYMETTSGLHFLNYLIFQGDNKITWQF